VFFVYSGDLICVYLDCCKLVSGSLTCLDRDEGFVVTGRGSL
jgi:hypothetical protein